MSDADSSDIRPGDSIKVTKGELCDKEGVVERIEGDVVWVSVCWKLDRTVIRRTAGTQTSQPARHAVEEEGSQQGLGRPANSHIVAPSELERGDSILILGSRDGTFNVDKLATFMRDAGTTYVAKIRFPGGQCADVEFGTEKDKIERSEDERPCEP